jgi:hypothetical protein
MNLSLGASLVSLFGPVLAFLLTYMALSWRIGDSPLTSNLRACKRLQPKRHYAALLRGLVVRLWTLTQQAVSSGRPRNWAIGSYRRPIPGVAVHTVPLLGFVQAQSITTTIILVWVSPALLVNPTWHTIQFLAVTTFLLGLEAVALVYGVPAQYTRLQKEWESKRLAANTPPPLVIADPLRSEWPTRVPRVYDGPWYNEDIPRYILTPPMPENTASWFECLPPLPPKFNMVPMTEPQEIFIPVPYSDYTIRIWVAQYRGEEICLVKSHEKGTGFWVYRRDVRAVVGSQGETMWRYAPTAMRIWYAQATQILDRPIHMRDVNT